MLSPSKQVLPRTARTNSLRHLVVTALLCGWCVLLVGGFAAFGTYARTPGAITTPSRAGVANVPVTGTGYTIVLGVHPKCTCTRATIAQLRGLLDSEPNIRSVLVLVSRPVGSFSDWERSELPQLFARMRDTRIEDDEGHTRADALGIATSGSVVLFDSAGRACYWGGLTPERGQVGDAPGIDMIRAIVHGTVLTQASSAVFGCPLESTVPNVAQVARGKECQR